MDVLCIRCIVKKQVHLVFKNTCKFTFVNMLLNQIHLVKTPLTATFIGGQSIC